MSAETVKVTLNGEVVAEIPKWWVLDPLLSCRVEANGPTDVDIESEAACAVTEASR